MNEYIINSRKKIVVKYVNATDFYYAHHIYLLYIRCYYKCFNKIKSKWIPLNSIEIQTLYDFEYHKEKLLESYKYDQDKKRKVKRLTLFK